MQVCLVHTDATLAEQKDLLKAADISIDLRQIRNLRFMSPWEIMEDVGRKFARLPRSVVYLGSGDYHHLTLLLQRRISEPFTLVVLDCHLDLFPAPPGFVSCGSWLKEALLLPQVEEVYLLGAKDPPGGSEVLTSAKTAARIKIYGSSDLYQVRQEIVGRLAGRKVYISLDKDVLTPPYAWTTWDQGSLRPGFIFYLFRALKEKAYVLGVDICGEYLPSGGLVGPEEVLRIRANEALNLALAGLFAGNRVKAKGLKGAFRLPCA